MTDRHIFAFAGARRHDAAPAGRFGGAQGLDGFADSAGLVDLDEDGVGRVFRRRVADEAGIGDKEVVADDLHVIAETRREGYQALGIILGERVLDRNDGVALEPAAEEVDHFGRGERAVLECEAVLPV